MSSGMYLREVLVSRIAPVGSGDVYELFWGEGFWGCLGVIEEAVSVMENTDLALDLPQ